MTISSDTPTIFITGAGGGMGRATAQRFAKEGWNLGLTDIDPDTLAETALLCGNVSVFTSVLDVTSEADWAEVMDAFGRFSGGRLDVLFNNAGIAPGGWFDEMPTDTVRSIIEVNVLGVMHGVRAGVELLKNTKDSLCISTSSSVATYGHAMRAAYSASKFAVKGLTEALSLEFERFGIRCADVLPGCIDTPMLRSALAARDGVEFDESLFDTLPKEGAYRLVPVSAIADAVWSAYSDPEQRDRIHWHVPEEVGDIDRLTGTDFAAARAETKAFLFGDG